ncbi:unnamed protein product [Penicillium roqueforti FM164]|uniref:Genomic scaffold, ProqFM164S02 n=1 Tax=Penicillium roqueforti (strain FM164) TaxID=1365484 RepID=W6QEP9_PENRF|nr:unnamed protein product [Penicillium roqueforti FM164]
MSLQIVAVKEDVAFTAPFTLADRRYGIWISWSSEPLGAYQSGPDNPVLPSVQSHGLHTIPSPVASNNAEHSIIEGEIYCGEWPNSARSRIRPRWRPTSVLYRVFRPRPYRLRTVVEFLNLWHRDTFIYYGSAMFIAGGVLWDFYEQTSP